jgi:hypothetical protein
MPRRPSRSPSLLIAVLTTLACVVVAARARGQACCAAAGVATPARLAPDELALVGTQWKVGDELGSFDPAGQYASSPPGASELDFEQDIFGAARLLDRGQVALFVPVVETRRTSLGQSEFGGGIGDVNVGVRYDFTLAGRSKIVPGLAGLVGVTLPTGTPPDAPSLGPLATGATGIGAYQINAGMAVEQTFGPWLVSATGIAAQRTARTVGAAPNQVHERLAPQWTALVIAAYTFPSEVALGVGVSYVVEDDATIGGQPSPGTGHRLSTLTLAGIVPLSNAWRLQGGLFDNLPITSLGMNQPAGLGLFAILIASWPRAFSCPTPWPVDGPPEPRT